MNIRVAPWPLPGRTRRFRRGLGLVLAMLMLWAAAVAPLASRLLASAPRTADAPWTEVCHSPLSREAGPRAQADPEPEDEACGYCKLFHRLPLLLADAPEPGAAPRVHAAPWASPARDGATERLWHPPGRGPPGA